MATFTFASKLPLYGLNAGRPIPPTIAPETDQCYHSRNGCHEHSQRFSAGRIITNPNRPTITQKAHSGGSPIMGPSPLAAPGAPDTPHGVHIGGRG